MSKASERVTTTMTEDIPEIKAEIRTLRVTDSFNLLLDQWANRRPPGVWEFTGPADHLLALMREKIGGNHGLPTDGTDLIRWLKLPASIKALREARILVAFVPSPRGPSSRGQRDPNVDPSAWPPMIKLERGHPDQYLDLGRVHS
jgi:hypothetical protein